MKKHRLIKPLLIICSSIILISCIGPKNKRLVFDYYTLNYDAPKPITESPLPYIISVEPFSAVPPYDSSRIIYTTGPYNINSYTYHKWMTSPAEMLTFFIARDLKSANIVQAVMVGDNRYATHELSGCIDAFCEQDQSNGWNALLSISITLIKMDESNITKKICLQKQFKAIEPCKEKNPKGLADALSLATSKLSQEIIADIQTALLK